MSRILLQLLWVSLTATWAYNYGPNTRPLLEYPQHDFYGDAHTRRVEYDPTIDKPTPAVRPKPSQRMNERAISLTSGIQHVQEKERRRVQSWMEESASRENGSYKIVNTPLKYPVISTRRGGEEEQISADSVVFPGRTSAQKFVPEIPKECEDMEICEHVPNYPKELISNIIAKLPPEKLGRLHIDLEEPEIAQRIGPDDNAEIPLCDYRETIIKPQAAKTKNGSWYIILNNYENPLQGYRVEICKGKGRSCADNIAYFYGGYTGICKQKYVQRTMAAVDVDRQEVLYDMPFRVPSCCSCVAMHTGNRK